MTSHTTEQIASAIAGECLKCKHVEGCECIVCTEDIRQRRLLVLYRCCTCHIGESNLHRATKTFLGTYDGRRFPRSKHFQAVKSDVN